MKLLTYPVDVGVNEAIIILSANPKDILLLTSYLSPKGLVAANYAPYFRSKSGTSGDERKQCDR